MRRLAEGLSAEDAGTILERLEPPALRNLSDIPAEALPELAGRLGLDRLSELAPKLSGRELLRVHDAFGEDAEALLRSPFVADLADPDVVKRLAAADRGDLIVVLGRGTSPKQVARVLALGDAHRKGLGKALLAYLKDQPPSEAAAAIRILEAEIRDGGHAILRHGPQVPDEALTARLETAVAPDGAPTSGHWASTRFRSFRAMERARARALGAMRRIQGVDLRYPPGFNGNPADTRFAIEVDHGKSVARGYIGQGPHHWIPHPNGNGGQARAWSKRASVDEAVTRTYLAVSWEDGRRKVVQQYPSAKAMDRATLMYTEEVNVYLRRPK